MNNNRYKEAIDKLDLKMDENRIMNQLPPSRKRKLPFKVIALVAISLVAFFIIRIENEKLLPLSQSVGDVKVILMGDKTQGVSTSSELAYFTEEQLLGWATDTFYGEVVTVENIEIIVGRYSDYRAIITLKVLEPFVTSFQRGELVTILLSNQIDSSMVATPNETYSKELREGQKAIILGMRYDEMSIYEADNHVLFLQELAQLGLPDGIRFVMLENEDTTFKYATHAYPSLGNKDDYESIKNYIINMKQSNF